MTEAQFYGMMVQTLVIFGVGAFFVERALYQVFNAKLRGKYIASRLEFWGFDLKPWISKAVCIWLVFLVDFDLFSRIFQYMVADPATGELVAASSVGTLVMSGLTMAGGSTWIFKQIRSFRKAIDGNGIETTLDSSGETITFSMPPGASPAPEGDFY